ncbi:hypothetical protein SAMN05444280_11625 [Tangfeifania diversioriginum]|uniref:Uncharacterized protein n=1 Tax=Tangfeifania diversioriginum TaxID=1168035 RepID=A0A1M6IB00_9BACT|nr:hypothetical protein [Tangfeifania diversioriginum]SHJ31640.1 hypothetical protein SAMN05444280_11625 [Tangfeifania diversioriginum]
MNRKFIPQAESLTYHNLGHRPKSGTAPGKAESLPYHNLGHRPRPIIRREPDKNKLLCN